MKGRSKMKIGLACEKTAFDRPYWAEEPVKTFCNEYASLFRDSAHKFWIINNPLTYCSLSISLIIQLQQRGSKGCVSKLCGNAFISFWLKKTVNNHHCQTSWVLQASFLSKSSGGLGREQGKEKGSAANNNEMANLGSPNSNPVRIIRYSNR